MLFPEASYTLSNKGKGVFSREIKRKFTCSPSTYGTYRKSNLTFDWITHESNKIKSTILPGWTVLEQFKALLILDDTSYCNFKIK